MPKKGIENKPDAVQMVLGLGKLGKVLTGRDARRVARKRMGEKGGDETDFAGPSDSRFRSRWGKLVPGRKRSD